jgi:hypothetical protein
MFKLLVKLALTALVANAAWRVGSAYVQFYKFSDAVSQTVQFGGRKTRAELQKRITDLAAQYDIPLPAEGFTIVRDPRNHTLVDGTLTQPIDLAPGYRYPWPFALHVDILSLEAPPPE